MFEPLGLSIPEDITYKVNILKFKITKEWLLSNSTSKGAYTKKQITALNLKWPTTTGWMKRLIGVEITNKQKQQFENNKTNFSKTKQSSNNVSKMVNQIIENKDELTLGNIKQLKELLESIN